MMLIGEKWERLAGTYQVVLMGYTEEGETESQVRK